MDLPDERLMEIKEKHSIEGAFPLRGRLLSIYNDYAIGNARHKTGCSLNERRELLKKLGQSANELVDVMNRLDHETVILLFESTSLFGRPHQEGDKWKWVPDFNLKSDFEGGLSRISYSAEKVLHELRGKRSDKDPSREKLLVDLGRLYKAATGREPGFSRDEETGELKGPFLRFLQDIIALLGIEFSSNEAMASAYKRADI